MEQKAKHKKPLLVTPTPSAGVPSHQRTHTAFEANCDQSTEAKACSL